MSFDALFHDKQFFEKGNGSADRTPLIYYGGKSRDADWILNHFPPHRLLVDVFGGGGAVSFAYTGLTPIVYNDIGTVSKFYEVLRDSPDELYKSLYFTPFGREEFDHCRNHWKEELDKGNLVEFARMWFVVINQGYTHEEESETWHVAKQVNSARAFSNHVDDLPRISARIRRQMHIERLDFAKLIDIYDLDDGSTLFYCDPPYTPSSRASQGNYVNEMPIERHVELLDRLQSIKGQAVVSMYDDPLYSAKLEGWRRDSITHKSAIQNSSSIDNRGDRTEVVFIKEHYHGLWQGASPDVSGVQAGVRQLAQPIPAGKRGSV